MARSPKTTTQALFLKRVQEEMRRQRLTKDDGSINVNLLAQRVGAPPQKTLDDIMKGADPRLVNVHKIAVALDVPAWTLFKEMAGENYSAEIKKFPQQPTMMGGPGQKIARAKTQRRTKDRG